MLLREATQRMQDDISDMKERVSFMETFMFFSEFKTESHGSRSETMKEVWKKRRAKQIENKDK